MIRKTKHCYKKPNSSSKPVSAIHLIDIYECLVIVIFLSFPSVFLLLLLSTLCMEFSVKIWQSLQRKISLSTEAWLEGKSLCRHHPLPATKIGISNYRVSVILLLRSDSFRCWSAWECRQLLDFPSERKFYAIQIARC